MNQAGFKLISFSFCPFVQRPRLVMLEKEITHSIEYIDLQHPPAWFHDISPLEKVPVLLVGSQALFESMPICEFLDEVSPGTLYPAEPLPRAQHRAWIEFGNDVLSLHHALVTAQQDTDFKRARLQLGERFEVLEEVLGDGPYFAGEKFGMVDVVYAPIFRFTQHIQRLCGLQLIHDDTPRVIAWAEQLLQRPSVLDAVPESFTDDYTGFIKRQAGVLSRQLAA
jgi:glutathione S-transferase